MIAGVGRRATILEQHALEAAIVSFAHRRVDAHVGRDAGEQMLRMPRWRRMSSSSVAQNDPLPGLSMIGSPGSGASSGMMSHPGFAPHEDPAARARVADPIRRHAWRERQSLLAGRSERSGRGPRACG